MSLLADTLIQAVQTKGAPGTPEAAFRSLAWSAHKKFGWPNRKTETWKYSVCTPLMTVPFSSENAVPTLTSAETAKVESWSKQFKVVVLKNGNLVSGKAAQPLSWELMKKISPQWQDGFAPAMAAAAQGGFYLEFGPDAKPTTPTMIVHFFDDQMAARSSLNMIHVHEGSRAKILEVWDGEGRGMSSTQTFVNADSFSELTLARVTLAQPYMKQFSDTQIHLAKASELKYLNVHLGAEWSRSSLTTTLAGIEASAELSGISFGMDQQHSDQRVEVRHTAAHTVSRQLFKGVWRDRSRGVINGKIYIAPGAQKVDSAQLNHNLLLSPQAEVDTKPELEVYADDVKANHGASLGRMDDEKLFYFISRGISRVQAVQLLAEGFVKDAVLKLGDSELESWILNEIRKAGVQA